MSELRASPGQADAPPLTGSGCRGRVLVIDDDAVFCEVLRAVLEDDGFDVATAPDGPAGLALMSPVPPDAILLDLNLVDADGLTFLVRLRAMGARGQMPVVVITAQDGDEHRERGRLMGADCHLTKPLDMEMLVWHLGELLSRSRHVRVNPLAGLRQAPTIPPGLV